MLDAVRRVQLVGCMAKNTLTPKAMVWLKSPHDFFSLNCDASISNGSASVGYGGLLRDEHSSMVCGFIHKIKRCSTIKAELRSIFNGVSKAQETGVRNLMIESDNAMTTHHLTDDVPTSRSPR